jgi:2-polyprenyl-3-methyl-5-hydroxy-6-metoxy-1,4-benzoquinol methylase
MMHLTEFSEHMLLCHRTDVAALPIEFTGGRRCAYFGRLVAWDVFGAEDVIGLLSSKRPEFTLDRYLDRFWLWSPAGYVKARQILLDLVFEALAPDYEQLIHPDQNRENIGYLIGVLTSHWNSLDGRVIVDFGCGVGLAAKVIRPASAHLIGIDRSSAMRHAAAAHGLQVWGPGEMARAQSDSIDGAFASYVFHLLPELGLLQLLWGRLKPGGAIAANFHKGRGIEPVSQCLARLGADEVVLPPPQSGFTHGEYRKFVRPSLKT